MQFVILFKTVNRVNGRVYFGVHRTSDLFFGTRESIDAYCGNTADIYADIKRYGRKAFIVEAIQGFANEQEAQPHLDRLIASADANSYNKPRVFTEEHKKKIAESQTGEKNAMFGKSHSDDTLQQLSAYRSSIKWINDGTTEKQIGKEDVIPEGWNSGRLYKPRKKRNKNSSVDSSMQEDMSDSAAEE